MSSDIPLLPFQTKVNRSKVQNVRNLIALDWDPDIYLWSVGHFKNDR